MSSYLLDTTLAGCGKTEVRQPISHDRSWRISGLRCEMGVRPRLFRNLPGESSGRPESADPFVVGFRITKAATNHETGVWAACDRPVDGRRPTLRATVRRSALRSSALRPVRSIRPFPVLL